MPSSPSDLDRSPLVPADLRDRLGAPWTTLTVVEETGSTNTDLLAAAAGGAPEGAVLVAESQTAGQGRLDRQWVAPPRASLTFSVLLRPTVPPLHLAWLPLLAGVATRHAVAEVTGVAAALKWPNDLLLGPDRRKAAGILAQAANGAVVLGIGLNVTNQREELPRPDATSIALEGGVVGRGALLVAVLRQFGIEYGAWQRAAGNPEDCGLLARYTAACDTLGREVTVNLPTGADLQGTATGIDTAGRLQIRTEAGDYHAIAAGDVIHVRPTP